MKTFLFVLITFVVYGAAVPALASSGRISGGEDAKRHQFPYIADIIWSVKGQFRQHLCQGVLISKKWVLTVGHCRVFPFGDYEIRLGQLNQNEDHEDVQIFKLFQFIVHPGFTGGVATNDIGLIELDRKVEITKAVQIARIAKEEECDALVNTVVSGWGAINSSEPEFSEVLQWATVPRITNKKCDHDLTEIMGFPTPLDDTMICTGARPGETQGGCIGDSGTPLVLEDGGALIGVYTWGTIPCGNKDAPSVYTRVCSHYDFINEYVKE